VICGAAEKLAPEKQSLKQFQRKTPRKSRSPRLRQWGLLRALRGYNFVASQLVDLLLDMPIQDRFVI